MNGEAKSGRLKGVEPGLVPLCFGFGFEVDDEASEGSSESFFSSTGSDCSCRNRMAAGSTDTMSPGANLVFAFWCCKERNKNPCATHLHRHLNEKVHTFFPLSSTSP